MATDKFQEQVDWIHSFQGDERKLAASVFSWQAVASTLNELVGQFNKITFSSENADAKRYREVQLKKIIVGLLYETNECFNYWYGVLKRANLDDQDIKDKKQAYETACKQVDVKVMKHIRNGAAFHFTDYLADPDGLIDVYQKVDTLSLDEINEVLRAANFCGYAMRDKVLEAIS